MQVFKCSLQGENFAQADDWYSQMKVPGPQSSIRMIHFNGWAMGGQNMCDIELAPQEAS